MEQPTPETPRSTLKRSSRGPVIAGVLALLVVVAFVAWRFWPRPHAPAPAEVAAPAPAAAPGAPQPDVTADPAQVRSALEPVSSDPEWRSWIAQPDAVRRAAVVIDNLGEGVSPRQELGFLAPKAPFTTEAHGKEQVIAAAAYARYDRFADTIASLDTPALAAAYRTLRPALQTAYRALGYPDRSIDDALARALGRLVAAPVRDGPVAVAADGGIFVYVDRELEKLPAVEKHLLRMGPRNERIVQEKAKALLDTLAIGKDAPSR